jgi:UTP--glucose-1-phosphate uridylyltransferase
MAALPGLNNVWMAHATNIRKAIFPVAGLGTRFLPATKAQPKEMLPVVDKPLIQYAVEEAYAADDLMVGTPPVLAQMVEQFNEWRVSILAVQEVPQEHTRRYGVVAGTQIHERLMDVSRIVEKPAPDVAPSRWGVAGRYILTPGVFKEIATQPLGVGGEIQLTDGIAALLRREKVFAYQYVGQRYDCGSKVGFLEANVALALEHPELREEFRSYLKGLVL